MKASNFKTVFKRKPGVNVGLILVRDCDPTITGTNLQILREHIKDESVDLIYLDPPFNSQASYNALFKTPTGKGSEAQIEAFDDSWHWNDNTEEAFDSVMKSRNSSIAEMLRALRCSLVFFGWVGGGPDPDWGWEAKRQYD
jgi:hypothetical protein